jgi:Flp pilus assembly protein TadD
VKDAAGHEISHSGFLQPDGKLDERAHSFTNRLVDKEGHLLDEHQIWDRRAVAYDATIQHGRSTLVRYEFRVPEGAVGPLTMTAQVNYRHFRQDYIDFVLGNGHPEYPVVDVASRTRVIQLGANLPDAAPAVGSAGKMVSSPDNPLWMRWNNFGIALLDQQQYLDSVRAFEKVAALRPDYADAEINIGLAYIAWEKYDDARRALEKALAMLQMKTPAPQPTTARAQYYMAVVDRNQGRLEAAVENLQKVVAAYPKSKDGRRELGFSYYQQHEYADAIAQYVALQGIDPDDLSAHYNLAILYRRIGDKQKAEEQAAYFKDEKDDPLSSTAALEFLRNHPAVSNESVPFHVHSDVAPLNTTHPTPAPAGTQGME